MKIKAILIDDERKSIETLKHSITKLCPNIEIIGETQVPEEGIQLIENLNPQLVFLDLAMPEMSGFDLLSNISTPNFEVIFATAFDEYAIEAIKHCAIGYIVKPIDDIELIEAVQRAAESIENKTVLEKNLVLIENIGQSFQDKKITIPTQSGLDFIKTKDIIYCEGTEGYTRLYFTHKRPPMLSSKSIGYYHKMLKKKHFYLTHKSYLINMSHIEKYENEGYILLTDNYKAPVSRNKRTDFLTQVREIN